MALERGLLGLGILLTLLCFCTAQKWRPTQQGSSSFMSPPRPSVGQRPKPGVQRPGGQRPGGQVSSDSKIPPPTFPNICAVEDHDKVPCGVPTTSAEECSAMECCHDGRSCFHPLSVTLHCTRDAQFIIVIYKGVTEPEINLDTVTFMGGDGDPNCAPVDANGAFAVYVFPATACGTTVREEDGYVIYENIMTSSYEVQNGPRGAITRDSSFELSVQCRYFGESVKALVVEVMTLSPPLSVTEFGDLRVDLRLGSGQCTGKGCVEEMVAYTSYYGDSDYPITRVLRDPVYVEVRMLERTDPNIQLSLGRCWTTTSPHPESMPQWDLLINGCPNIDDRYQTKMIPVGDDVEFPSHYKRFVLRMFTFVDQAHQPMQEVVYIHCETSVCDPSKSSACTPRCAHNKFKRDLSQTDMKKTVVSSKPIKVFAATKVLQEGKGL